MCKSVQPWTSLAVIATAAVGFVPCADAAVSLTVSASGPVTQTVEGTSIGHGYVLNIVTDDNSMIAAVDFQSGTGFGITGAMFQTWSSTDPSDSTPTGGSLTNKDSHIYNQTATQKVIVAPNENNNVYTFTPVTDDGTGNDYGFGSTLQGVIPYVTGSNNQIIAYLVLRDAPLTGLVPVTTAQINSGAAKLVFSATGLASVAGASTNVLVSQQFGVLTSTPEPASLSVIGLGAMALLRRRRV